MHTEYAVISCMHLQTPALLGCAVNNQDQLNMYMKELLKILPQLLSAMPEIIKYLKYIPILKILGGIGYGVLYYAQNHKDPYVCVNNHVFEQLRVDSDIYVFKGGTCVDSKDLEQ